jgi:hypothetical protein
MSFIVQYVDPLFAYLSINCLFHVIRPLLCFNAFKLLLLFFILLLYTFCLLFCVFWNLYCFSLCIILFLPFVYKCKDHFYRVEIQLQEIKIVSYQIGNIY